MNFNIWCSWDISNGGENGVGDWIKTRCSKLGGSPGTRASLLLSAPFHGWGRHWDFPTIALPVSDGARTQTPFFWFQILRALHSILCHPSAPVEAVSKPKATVDAGTPRSGWDHVFRWGPSEALNACCKVTDYPSDSPKLWAPTPVSPHPPLFHSWGSSWFFWVGLECQVDATFNRPRSKEPASYGKWQFCWTCHDFWAVTWVLHLWRVEACEDFVLFVTLLMAFRGLLMSFYCPLLQMSLPRWERVPCKGFLMKYFLMPDFHSKTAVGSIKGRTSLPQMTGD